MHKSFIVLILDIICMFRNTQENIEYQYIEGFMHLLVFSFTLRKCTVQNAKIAHIINI
jgi:hypothetical protein